MPSVKINGEIINEYTYRLTDPRNPFTQPKEVCGVDIEEELRKARPAAKWSRESNEMSFEPDPFLRMMLAFKK